MSGSFDPLVFVTDPVTGLRTPQLLPTGFNAAAFAAGVAPAAPGGTTAPASNPPVASPTNLPAGTSGVFGRDATGNIAFFHLSRDFFLSSTVLSLLATAQAPVVLTVA